MVNFCNYVINRYSYLSIFLMAMIVVITCILCIAYVVVPHSGGESRTTVFLFLISYFPAIFIPVMIALTVFIFKFLEKKENKNSNLLIKNTILKDIPAIRITFFFLFILSIIFLFFFLIYTIWSLMQPYNNYLRFLFFCITIPILIFITIIYLFVCKKFLQN